MHAHDSDNLKRLLFSVVFTALFALIEAIGGYFSNSLALIGDAGHMFTDSLGLSIAAFASWIAIKPPSTKHSFGYARAEVIAAFLSSMLMLLISISIIITAIKRFLEPEIVHGQTVMIIAGIGLLVNIAIAYVLHYGQSNINIRAALLHVIGDILGSIAALSSGLMIVLFQWPIVDPILSILISILIFYGCIQLLNESLGILMQCVPADIDLEQLKLNLKQTEGVIDIHSLHVWVLSSKKIILSAHIHVNCIKNWPKVLHELGHRAKHYQIDHITLQPETIESDCQNNDLSNKHYQHDCQ